MKIIVFDEWDFLDNGAFTEHILHSRQNGPWLFPPKSPLPVYVATPICTAHPVLFLRSAGALGNHRTQSTPRGRWAAQPSSGPREEAAGGRVHERAGEMWVRLLSTLPPSCLTSSCLPAQQAHRRSADSRRSTVLPSLCFYCSFLFQHFFQFTEVGFYPGVSKLFP